MSFKVMLDELRFFTVTLALNEPPWTTVCADNTGAVVDTPLLERKRRAPAKYEVTLIDEPEYAWIRSSGCRAVANRLVALAACVTLTGMAR
jgi:hypothetical protein